MTTAYHTAPWARKALTFLALAGFTAVSAIALWEHGYWGTWKMFFINSATWQFLFDLCISLGMVLTWIRRDAKRNKRMYWPWVAATIAMGSFGPLLYLALPTLIGARGRTSPKPAKATP